MWKEIQNNWLEKPSQMYWPWGIRIRKLDTPMGVGVRRWHFDENPSHGHDIQLTKTLAAVECAIGSGDRAEKDSWRESGCELPNVCVHHLTVVSAGTPGGPGQNSGCVRLVKEK
jgi:hypothetical protein